MTTLACGLTIAVLAGMAAGDDAVKTYRTHGAVSARPACGYTDELQNLLPQSARLPAGTWRAAAAAPGIPPAVEPNADTGPSGEREAARVTFDASDVSIAQDASNPNNARWGIIYNDTSAGKEAVAFLDLGGVTDLSAGAFRVTWNANGIFSLT